MTHPEVGNRRKDAALALVDRGFEPGSPQYNRQLAEFDRRHAPAPSGVEAPPAEQAFSESLTARGYDPNELTGAYREQLSEAPWRPGFDAGSPADAGRADALLASLLAEQQRAQRDRLAGGIPSFAAILAGSR